jgi:hypothetical protein
MYKMILIACLFYALCASTKSADASVTNSQDTVLIIAFEDHFKNDEISLAINNKSIFKGEVISSHQAGVTDMELVFIKRNRLTLCNYENKYISVKTKLRQNITVKLNGRINKFLIDLKVGKYVGLSKKDGNKFYLWQSKTPFFYD